jgi:hypothetical protein
MMTRLITAAVAAVALCPQASAVSFFYERYGDAYALFLDGEELNGKFDTIDFSAEPISPTTFDRIVGGIPGSHPGRPPGDPFTYINPRLTGDPLDHPEYQGWTMLGVFRTANRVAFAGSPLGQKIDTSGQANGDLFLANLMLSEPYPAGKFTARVQLISAGTIVADLVAVPEPATGVLGVVAASAIAMRRRAVGRGLRRHGSTNTRRHA